MAINRLDRKPKGTKEKRINIVPVLCETIMNGEYSIETRRNAMEKLFELAKSGDCRAIRSLAGLLEDDEMCNTAAYWLGKLGPNAAPALRKFLERSGTNANARAWAVRLLGEIRDKKSLKDLMRLANDEDRDVRFQVAYALGLIGDKSAIPVLKEMLRDERNREIVARVAASLKELGYVDDLVTSLTSPE